MKSRPRHRTLATVLFTDIVDSTGIARELGDARYRELLVRHHRLVRREIKRSGGRELDTAGDGFFIAFDGIDGALRCACALVDTVRPLGIEIRGGVHTGEVEPMDGKVGGIAVHAAARVLSLAGPGEVLVTGTVRDLAAGSGVSFEPRGTHELKGLEGRWPVHAVAAVDGVARPAPTPSDEAAAKRDLIEPPRIVRRRAGRLLLAGAIGLAAVITIAIFAFRSPDEETLQGALRAPASSVAAVDLDRGRVALVVTEVPTSTVPQFGISDIDIGEGAVWLVRFPRLLRVDPDDGTLESVQGIPNTYRIATGFLAVWVQTEGAIWRVSPATMEPQGQGIPFVTETATPTDLATGLGSVWVSRSDGALGRIDPDTRRIEKVRIASAIDRLAVGAGAVWALDTYAARLYRFDPATGKTVSAEVSPGASRFAVGEGYVWVLDPGAGILTPIGVDDMEPLQSIALEQGSADLVVGDGAVWVASGGDLVEIDPLTRTQRGRIPVGAASIARVALDPETAWAWVDMAES